jgi:DNA-binding NtrC family response regulator
MMETDSRADGDVLVVDDEEVVRQAVARVLSEEGLTVAGAADASSALRHPALGACRLVLCDLMLPDQSGIALVRELRARRAGLPVVCITGYATPEIVAQAVAAGAAAFLPKPFDGDELLSVVRRVLGGASAIAEEKDP